MRHEDEETIDIGSFPKAVGIRYEEKDLFALRDRTYQNEEFLFTIWSFKPSQVCSGDGIEKPLAIQYIRGIRPGPTCPNGQRLIVIRYVWSL